MLGKQILHYKILEKLGEGGMGVVYKAEDTKLERMVALKFLPTNTISGEEEKKRFKREAKAAAALNHPNICHIYAIDEADEQMFIAMEFIEGTPLNPPLSRGDTGVSRPLPLDKAINYATQIAAGLQAAHEKGVIHRDIKSANIMVTDKGVIKIMDFGLAKLANRSKMTIQGSTLGTAAYMSPEQARGEDLDKRSDIWSLGVVLYEMIAGRLPFKGDYEQAVIYSILNEEPEPLTALRSGLPIALDGIVAKALAKDPNTRYQHVDELPADLKGLALASLSRSRISVPTTGIQMPSKERIRNRVPWSIAALGLLLALMISIVHFNETPRPRATIRSSILSPSQTTILSRGGKQIALSPDGKTLAFVAEGADQGTDLWVRRLDQLAAQKLAGTAGARQPFWSPDSRFIGFFAGGQLKKVDVTGAAVNTICNVLEPFGGTWNRTGDILFGSGLEGSGLQKVAAAGGEPIVVTKLDTSNYDWSHRYPHFLPDGRHFLYFASNIRRSGAICIAKLPETGKLSDEPFSQLDSGIRLIETESNMAFAEGHVLFVQDNTLMAKRFDPETLEFSGEPQPIANGIRSSGIDRSSTFSVSENGILVYLSGDAGLEAKLIILNRQGQEVDEVTTANFTNGVLTKLFSPDNKKVAMTIVNDNNWDLWIYDLERELNTRITFDPAIDMYPVWFPDGKRLAFISNRKGRMDLYQTRADGSGKPSLLYESNLDKFPYDMTPDGNFIVYSTLGSVAGEGMRLLSLKSTIKEAVFLRTPYTERSGFFAPNGKWLAYETDETGRYEIFVRPFPAAQGKWRVSVNGGVNPRWRQDGGELYYVSQKNQVMASQTASDSHDFRVISSKPLFQLPGESSVLEDVTSDGKKFLVQVPVVNRTDVPLTLVTNWTEELHKE